MARILDSTPYLPNSHNNQGRKGLSTMQNLREFLESKANEINPEIFNCPLGMNDTVAYKESVNPDAIDGRTIEYRTLEEHPNDAE